MKNKIETKKEIKKEVREFESRGFTIRIVEGSAKVVLLKNDKEIAVLDELVGRSHIDGHLYVTYAYEDRYFDSFDEALEYLI